MNTRAELVSEDLASVDDIVSQARVVGIARGAHGASELTRLTHRLVRHLVDAHEFRTLAIESSATTVAAVNTWLQTGDGDPTALLANIEPWWRTPEAMEILSWLHHRNRDGGGNVVQLIGLEPQVEQDMDALERSMADALIRWVEDSGQKTVYWSGSHSAVGRRRLVRWQPSDGGAGSANAGSRLREHFGDDYVSLGMTFHHGTVRWGDGVVAVPPAPPGFLDTLLDSPGTAVHLVDLRRKVLDLSVAAIAQAPLRFRLIGPHYTPAWTSHMRGGTVAEFFDAVLHLHVVTPSGQPM